MKADSKSFVGALKASPNVFWAVVIGALSLAAFFATGALVTVTVFAGASVFFTSVLAFFTGSAETAAATRAGIAS